MTLKEFLVKRGYWSGSGNRCKCPFHEDNNPSCFVNDNHIYCFAEQRSYTIFDFQRKFRVRLERVVEPSNLLKSINEPKFTNEVLFTYPWGDS